MSSDQLNIILTGFMGTGKTCVGQELARRLGLDFLDTDCLIEASLGMPVAQIFERCGEPFFREQERRVVAQAAKRRRTVIATGGGTLLEEANLSVLGSTGVVICLHAGIEVLLERLGHADGRPLLVATDLRSRLEALLASRGLLYARLPHHIDTTGLTVGQVVERAMALYREAKDEMSQISTMAVPGTGCHVCLGHGVLDQAGAILHSLGLSGKAIIVTNPRVGSLYASRVRASLERSGFAAHVLEVPEGEAHKTLDTVQKLYLRFLSLELERSSPVLTLGGGVIGDLAGFAAATFMRGLPLVHVPTTLLAMIDSSIGGKVGVDLPEGKNLVGCFYQPRAVLADPDVLATLPPEELRSGLAEAVKAAIIASPGLFRRLEAGQPWPLLDIIHEAVRIKVDVVAADPTEQGGRVVLNLGHTVGHAIEAASNFRYRHGDAVSVGLVAATRLARSVGLCPNEVEVRLSRTLKRLALPTSSPDLELAAVLAALNVDKKRRHDRWRWVLPLDIGQVTIDDSISPPVIQSVLAGLIGPDADAESA